VNDDNLPRHSGVDDSAGHDAGDDRLSGRVGDDQRDGGRGTDTAVFDGNRGAYTIARADDEVWGRLHVSGADSGHDILDNIERLEFADGKLAFDLDAGQAGGNTIRLVAAAFGAASVHQRPDYIGIGISLFDAGHSIHDVAELAVKAMGLDDSGAFVDVVYRNVAGVATSQEIQNELASLLQEHGGTMSRADLLVAGANTEANAQQIDIVGLMQSGIDYV
jgi:hypothetical protein